MEDIKVRYLKVKEASRVTGEKPDAIRYHIRVGNIQYKRLPSGGILVHVDQNGNLVYKEVANA